MPSVSQRSPACSTLEQYLAQCVRKIAISLVFCVPIVVAQPDRSTLSEETSAALSRSKGVVVLKVQGAEETYYRPFQANESSLLQRGFFLLRPGNYEIELSYEESGADGDVWKNEQPIHLRLRAEPGTKYRIDVTKKESRTRNAFVISSGGNRQTRYVAVGVEEKLNEKRVGTKAEKMEENPEEQWFAKGEQAFRSGDYSAAVNMMSKAISADRKLVHAYHIRAQAQAAKNQHLAAINDFGIAVQLAEGLLASTPDDDRNAKRLLSHIRLDRARSYMALEQFWAAINDYDRSVSIDPVNAAAYFYKGECYRQMGDCAEAKNEYRRFLNFRNIDNVLAGKARREMRECR